jgi:hypothetical protein
MDQSEKIAELEKQVVWFKELARQQKDLVVWLEKLNKGDGLTQNEKNDLLGQANKDGRTFEFLCGLGVDCNIAEAVAWKTPGRFIEESEKFSLDEIELVFEAIAALEYDGHYTLLRFTSGYKAAFGSPDLRTRFGAEQVLKLKLFSKAKDAMVAAIADRIDFY